MSCQIHKIGNQIINGIHMERTPKNSGGSTHFFLHQTHRGHSRARPKHHALTTLITQPHYKRENMLKIWAFLCLTHCLAPSDTSTCRLHLFTKTYCCTGTQSETSSCLRRGDASPRSRFSSHHEDSYYEGESTVHDEEGESTIQHEGDLATEVERDIQVDDDEEKEGAVFRVRRACHPEFCTFLLR
jgi:hypothetical protein